MSQEEVHYCPICRKNPLPPEQILCPDCQADNPYNLLGGYSPTKKIYDELTKIGEYKDKITTLQKQLTFAGVLILLLCAGIVGMVWMKFAR